MSEDSQKNRACREREYRELRSIVSAWNGQATLNSIRQHSYERSSDNAVEEPKYEQREGQGKNKHSEQSVAKPAVRS